MAATGRSLDALRADVADDLERLSPEFRRFLAFKCLHDSQELFICSDAQTIVLHGPNTTGKSPSGAMRLLIRTTGWVPTSLLGKLTLPPREYRGRQNAYAVIGITREQLEGAAWAALLEWLPPEFVHPSSTKKRIVLRRFVDDPANPGRPLTTADPGCVIEQRTVETGRKRQQGRAYAGVWLDEDDGRDGVFDEFVTQAFKLRGFIQLTNTALESQEKGGKTWFAERILAPAFAARREHRQRRVVLDDGTLVILSYRGDQIDKRTGKLVTEAELKELDKKYPRESIRRLRVDGEWEVVPDQPYYDEKIIEQVYERFRATAPVFRRGSMTPSTDDFLPEGVDRAHHPEFRESASGMLYVFEDPDPLESYTVGADAASGGERDYTAFIVRARRSPRVVAVFYGHIDPFESKVQYRLLGRWYNRAWYGPEDDRFGRELIGYLRDVGETSRIVRRPTSEADEVRTRTDYGYAPNTNLRTRLDEAIKARLATGEYDLRFEPLLMELKQYGYYGREVRGRQVGDHPPTGHDDLQKALGYAIVTHEDTPLPPLPKHEDRRIEQASGASLVKLMRQKALDAALKQARGGTPWQA